MDNSQLVVSAAAVNRILVLLLAAPICAFAFWRMIPRLSPAFGVLASAALLVQALSLGIALGLLPIHSDLYWLWDPNREYNIPSTLASTQLALVAILALGTAWLQRRRFRGQSLYLAAVGGVILFLALDEYFVLHEQFQHWKRYYAALGALLVSGALRVALRRPRSSMMWYLCFPVGLVIAGSGAVFIELIPESCGDLGLLRLDGCLNFALLEEASELLGIWLAMLGMLGMFADAMPTPNARLRHVMTVTPAIWLLMLFVNSRIPSLELQLLAQPASVEFELAVRLRGYRIDRRADEAVHVRLFTASKRGRYAGLEVELSLVAQDSGETVASQRAPAVAHSRYWMLRPGASLIYPQSLTVNIPSQTGADGAHWIVLALFRDEGDELLPQRALASDLQLLDDERVILGEIGGSAEP
ncbi:MAG: hypothetical protein OXG85_01680 [Chloroflexi bacterium]|nr:hypothetical protein [Chloroflexota bacterium]